eukprot:g146.t1
MMLWFLLLPFTGSKASALYTSKSDVPDHQLTLEPVDPEQLQLPDIPDSRDLVTFSTYEDPSNAFVHQEKQSPLPRFCSPSKEKLDYECLCGMTVCPSGHFCIPHLEHIAEDSSTAVTLQCLDALPQLSPCTEEITAISKITEACDCGGVSCGLGLYCWTPEDDPSSLHCSADKKSNQGILRNLTPKMCIRQNLLSELRQKDRIKKCSKYFTNLNSSGDSDVKLKEELDNFCPHKNEYEKLLASGKTCYHAFRENRMDKTCVPLCTGRSAWYEAKCPASFQDKNDCEEKSRTSDSNGWSACKWVFEPSRGYGSCVLNIYTERVISTKQKEYMGATMNKRLCRQQLSYFHAECPEGTFLKSFEYDESKNVPGDSDTEKINKAIASCCQPRKCVNNDDPHYDMVCPANRNPVHDLSKFGHTVDDCCLSFEDSQKITCREFFEQREGTDSEGEGTDSEEGEGPCKEIHAKQKESVELELCNAKNEWMNETDCLHVCCSEPFTCDEHFLLKKLNCDKIDNPKETICWNCDEQCCKPPPPPVTCSDFSKQEGVHCYVDKANLQKTCNSSEECQTTCCLEERTCGEYRLEHSPNCEKNENYSDDTKCKVEACKTICCLREYDSEFELPLHVNVVSSLKSDKIYHKMLFVLYTNSVRQIKQKIVDAINLKADGWNDVLSLTYGEFVNVQNTAIMAGGHYLDPKQNLLWLLRSKHPSGESDNIADEGVDIILLLESNLVHREEIQAEKLSKYFQGDEETSQLSEKQTKAHTMQIIKAEKEYMDQLKSKVLEQLKAVIAELEASLTKQIQQTETAVSQDVNIAESLSAVANESVKDDKIQSAQAVLQRIKEKVDTSSIENMEDQIKELQNYIDGINGINVDTSSWTELLRVWTRAHSSEGRLTQEELQLSNSS